MIELIFAIVVIGISVISLPMVIQVTAEGITKNYVQEAIFAASAELNQALSYKWDVNSRENPGELSKVLHTGSPSDCNASDGTQRPGHVHRMCLNTTTAPSIPASVSGDDSISGNRITDGNLTEIGDISSGSGYKDFYTMDVEVAFSNFGGSTNNNMKEIKITVKENGNKYVELRTYSANIGETEAAKRVF
jgi:Tfp pilus assembly major pilin PilA